MNKLITQIILTSMFSMLFFPLLAQVNIDIDLRDQSDEIITQSISSGKEVIINIKNKLPGKKYNIKIERKFQVIESLNSPFVNERTEQKANNNTCSELQTLVNSLYDLKEENMIPKLKIEIEKKISTISEDILKMKEIDSCPILLIRAKDALRKTNHIYNQSKLKKGENIEITITRKVNDSLTKTWQYIYKTPIGFKFVTSYGFTYINEHNDDESTYFTQQKEDGNFMITKKEKRHFWKYVPTIFFSVLQDNDITDNFKVGATAGLGLNLESPSVLFGLNGTFYQNISVIFGGTFYRRNRQKVG